MLADQRLRLYPFLSHVEGERPSFIRPCPPGSTTQLRSDGVDIGVISKQLRHRCIATTTRCLDHIAPSQIIETIRRRDWSLQ
jgi:hypothetical protein